MTCFEDTSLLLAICIMNLAQFMSPNLLRYLAPPPHFRFIFYQHS